MIDLTTESRPLLRTSGAETSEPPVFATSLMPLARSAWWVFAHGSLMFRPDIEVSATLPARVEGMTRRFGHPSVRNWGRPAWPAPTTCLVPGDGVEGLLLAVSPSDLERLCRREAGPPVEVAAETLEGHAVPALTWTMTSEWTGLGTVDLVPIGVANVRHGGGPFGGALDYVAGVVAALTRRGCHDPSATGYLSALEAAIAAGRGRR